MNTKLKLQANLNRSGRKLAWVWQRGTEGMSTPELVAAFYNQIWNEGKLDAADMLLTPKFLFRGSLGNEMVGREEFKNYVRSVRGALEDYHCEILACVAEGRRVFAKMRFHGRHVAPLRGFEPTGKTVQWLGAALFHLDDSAIAELWVLGDLAGLDQLLKAQAAKRGKVNPL